MSFENAMYLPVCRSFNSSAPSGTQIMTLPASMRRQAFFPDSSDLPSFTTKASASVLRVQASYLLRHPFPVETGHTMPLMAAPGAGKTVFLKRIMHWAERKT
ncbi:hypothetical protein [Erwinia amylovora]|uniref:hypothetical protein n=1 Tax=Erwinia amylovora TaxID=552 RepID=UPI0020C0A561|nr:hypothetical protein [Erwinia amylovora]MCK8417614.1 hypothetical protein [Erwinia amylovora]